MRSPTTRSSLARDLSKVQFFNPSVEHNCDAYFSVNHLGCDIWENFKTVAVKPVYPSSSKDRETDCDQKGEGDLQEPEIEIDSQCVMISGVAPDVTKKDLVHELLKDCRITKYGLYMETQENKCTGKCYVEFVDQV